MRRVIKNSASTIVSSSLKYPKNAAAILTALLKEQKGLCAYTDDFIDMASMSLDVEHFNPDLKNTPKDNYDNWFAVSHQFNNEKRRNWKDYQPIMHPTDEALEENIYYSGGYYLVKEDNIKASNLYNFLRLDNPDLANDRIAYIKGLKELVELYGDGINGLIAFLQRNITFIRFPRAIREEFGIDILGYIA